jgi:hypothetical protein
MSTVLFCLPLSVSSAISLIAVPVCSVFHNKSLTVDAVVLYIFKTCAGLVLCVCVCVCVCGAETLSLINVVWRGMAPPGALYVPLSVIVARYCRSPYSCPLNLFL